MVVVRGRLEPEVGALLVQALSAARDTLDWRARTADRGAGQADAGTGPGPVPAETSRRLACDASLVLMRHGRDGRVVEVAALRRTIPPALRRALHHRDRGCRFPGCGLPSGQGHHLRHWAQGGPTTLSNLALLCRRHHRPVHEEGYRVDRLNAHTATPGWLGESFDVRRAIDVLHPLPAGSTSVVPSTVAETGSRPANTQCLTSATRE